MAPTHKFPADNDKSCEKDTSSVTLNSGLSKYSISNVECNNICVSEESGPAHSAQPEVGSEQLGPGQQEAGQADQPPGLSAGSGQDDPGPDPGMPGPTELGPSSGQASMSPLCSTAQCAQVSAVSPQQHCSSPASKEKM